ncbi:hypothetical protein NP233_g12451 [Leucocoprinus birnbaumii]|uniref:Uncharacterized protein n=1 Tax=Leucocoprinus birnbaumii TaxID=56174 RepID=A0AAD5VK52_9AGAR|nr:hypothetical protein NP233_g12451 [Leucocoprinus birnbaumii]
MSTNSTNSSTDAPSSDDSCTPAGSRVTVPVFRRPTAVSVFGRPTAVPCDLPRGWKRVPLQRSYAKFDVTDGDVPLYSSSASSGISAERLNTMRYGIPYDGPGPLFRYENGDAMKTVNESTAVVNEAATFNV